MNIDIDIPEQLLKDVLVTAVEGGSNYWARYSALVRDASLDILSVTVTERDSSTHGPAVSKVITPKDLLAGLETLSKADFPNAKPALMRVIDEDYDAGDADIVLQMTVLGELVYG